MFKNTASQRWVVFAFDVTDGTPETGDAANISANIDIDGAGLGALTDAAPAELGNGYYAFDLTQAETNGDELHLEPESSTANIEVLGCPAVVYTRPPNFSDLGIESDGDLTKVNTLDGHTAQTGDSFGRIGANGSGLVEASADGFTEIKGATWASGTDTLEHIRDELTTIEGKVDTVDGVADAILVDTGTTLPATLTTMEGKIDTVDGVADSILSEIQNGTYGLSALEALVDDLESRIPDTVSLANINAQVDSAIETYHLDHILAVAFDPASPPGHASSLWNQITENDGGVARFTTNALENGPSGSGVTTYFITGAAVQDTDNIVSYMTWGLKNGVPQTSASDCNVQLILTDKDGTITTISGAEDDQSTPDANGVFNGSFTSALLAGRQYYILVSMTIDAASRTGMIPVMVPVRTE